MTDYKWNWYLNPGCVGSVMREKKRDKNLGKWGGGGVKA